MTEGPKSGPHQRKWWRLYVHKIQMRYAIMLGAMLLIFSLVVFGLAIIGPSVTLDPKVAASLPFTERAQFATRLLFGGETAFPIILVVLIPGLVVFSFYVTHRLAGPLYRLEKVVKEVQGGDLSLRIQLRQGDDLMELAEAFNQTLIAIDQALAQIRGLRDSEQKCLQRCLDEMRAQAPAHGGLLDQVELAVKEGEQIDAVLKKFHLSSPQ